RLLACRFLLLTSKSPCKGVHLHAECALERGVTNDGGSLHAEFFACSSNQQTRIEIDADRHEGNKRGIGEHSSLASDPQRCMFDLTTRPLGNVRKGDGTTSSFSAARARRQAAC